MLQYISNYCDNVFIQIFIALTIVNKDII